MLVTGILIMVLSMVPEGTPQASPLCKEYPSAIVPDMQWRDDDFTFERSIRALEFLTLDFPEWLNRRAERGFFNDGEKTQVIEGEAFLAYNNRLIAIKGYLLKERLKNSSEEDRADSLKAYCEFRAATPIYD